MPRYLHTNNANSNLRDAITAASGTIRVTAGHGTLFPNPGVDEAFFVTVEDRRIGRIEIMLCTQRVTDTLTVTRGQQGTVPQSFGVGVNVSNRVTATILNEFVESTVGVIPLSRLPLIPDAKIIALQATKLVGEINSARLPVIPPSLLTNVPSPNLVGVVPMAAIPTPLIEQKIPQLTGEKILYLDVEKLVGIIELVHIPILPSAKISDLDASKLTGTIPSARLTGSYGNFVNINGDGNATFNRFAGNSLNHNAPTFSFLESLNSGLYYLAGYGPGISVAGDLKMYVSASEIRAVAGVSFAGSGNLLTGLNAAGLPTTEAANNWVGARLADLTIYEVGDVGFFYFSGTVPLEPGNEVAGGTLRASNAAGDIAGPARFAGEKWSCQGWIVGGSPSQIQRTTLFRRVE